MLVHPYDFRPNLTPLNSPAVLDLQYGLILLVTIYNVLNYCSLYPCRDKAKKRKEKQNRKQNGETSPTHSTANHSNGTKFETPAPKDVSLSVYLFTRFFFFVEQQCARVLCINISI